MLIRRFWRSMRRARRRLLLVFLTPIALLLAGVLYVHAATAPYRYHDPAVLPPERVALVFGAGVRGDRPTPMLAQRIDAAVLLYQRGLVDKLLMTGDNSSVNYDEVSAMRSYAEDRGVDPTDITLDYAGFSTYESCYRARAIFGVAQAVLVTQAFHLPRAVYTCRALGIDAVGLGTPDWGRYADVLIARYTAREALATIKALVELHITRPQPTFLGPFEGLATAD